MDFHLNMNTVPLEWSRPKKFPLMLWHNVQTSEKQRQNWLFQRFTTITVSFGLLGAQRNFSYQKFWYVYFDFHDEIWYLQRLEAKPLSCHVYDLLRIEVNSDNTRGSIIVRTPGALHCIPIVIHRNCGQAMIRIVISLHSPLCTRSKGKRDLINMRENELIY